MKRLFEVRAHDRRIYDEQLRDWLPERLIDVHTHVWLDRFMAPVPEPGARRTVSWPGRVARENSIEDLIESYRLFFPGKDVGALIFPYPARAADVDAMNAYVADSVARHAGFDALMLAFPEWDAEEFEARLEAGRFPGIKVYLNLAPAYLPAREIRIFDFLPHHQLAVLDRRGGIVMLHIPRNERLRDPVNLHQMLDIEQRYPGVKLIIAHVGRAYCDGDVGAAFEFLKPATRMLWDFSANTNSTVFRHLIEAVGPKRILFGSDLPILRMRMRRIEEDGRYINLVPPGLYGDVSDDPNMREVDAAEGARLTFFMYEELLAFRRATDALGLNRQDIEAIFHGNAAGLLGSAVTR